MGLSEYLHGACHLPQINHSVNRKSRELSGVHGSFQKTMDIALKVKEVALHWGDQIGREIAEMPKGIEVGRCARQACDELVEHFGPTTIPFINGLHPSLEGRG